MEAINHNPIHKFFSVKLQKSFYNCDERTSVNTNPIQNVVDFKNWKYS